MPRTKKKGFPRSRDQAGELSAEGIVPDLIIMLERPDELVREFSMGRCTDPTTGVIYHPKVATFDCFFRPALGWGGLFIPHEGIVPRGLHSRCGPRALPLLGLCAVRY